LTIASTRRPQEAWHKTLTVGVTFGLPLATVIHENMKFSNRRQKCSYNDALINVAVQHFFETAPRRPGMAAILSIFAQSVTCYS
jgi:hypothetical protein